jgi:hypothetical protein
MSSPFPTLSLDELAAATGGRRHVHRPTAPNAAAPAASPISPEPPVSAGPGADLGLGIGRTARSYRPGSPR